MFKNLSKKLVVFFLAIGCSAAFAYPPYCHVKCKYLKVGTAQFVACVDACEINCENNPGSCPSW